MSIYSGVTFGKLCFSRNLSISSKLFLLAHKLLIMSLDYLFNVCRICGDAPSSSPNNDNLCLFSLLMISPATGLSILFIFSKNQLLALLIFSIIRPLLISAHIFLISFFSFLWF